MRQVPYVNFPAQYAAERDELLALVDGVFSRGEFVGGATVDAFEAEMAAFIGVRHVVALNSGTDALIMGMKALDIGPGDEVITAPNSFVASAAAIIALGAVPVFADVRDDQNIDPGAVAAAITPRTKAIMPVHLTGRVAHMEPILALAERHHLAVVEDACQSIGSRYQGRASGSMGNFGAFSAHPLKNLNAAGDGGYLTTDDDALARTVRLARNHGLVDRNTVESWGLVSRMDVLQAEILRLRLRTLPQVIERRRANAVTYRRLLAGLPIFMPPCAEYEYNTFHLFVVQTDKRDALQAFLTGRGIGTAIHYPTPIHLQPAARGLGLGKGDFPVAERQAEQILSLPINQFVSEADIVWIVESMAAFFAGVTR